MLCGWSAGIGFRFIYEYLAGVNDCYWLNAFDLWFDWITLVFLGCLTAGITLSQDFPREDCKDEKHARAREHEGIIRRDEVLRVHQGREKHGYRD